MTREDLIAFNEIRINTIKKTLGVGVSMSQACALSDKLNFLVSENKFWENMSDSVFNSITSENNANH